MFQTREIQVQRPLAEAQRAGLRVGGSGVRRMLGRGQIIQGPEMIGLHHENSGFWNYPQ